jgi:uncharacterized protein with HEPN domain
MVGRSIKPRLTDIIESIDRIRNVIAGTTLEAFENDWQKRWLVERRLVERRLEILSEASRHLPEATKARHPEIPWPKVAGIGNVLRHDYQRIAPDVLWKLVRDDLPGLEQACRDELATVLARERD